MSRIGKLPISIPAGVTVEVNGNVVTVKGPKGTLTVTVNKGIAVKQEENVLICTRANEQKQTKQKNTL